MAVSCGYLEYVLEQMAHLGRVDPKRMFGGVGLYCDGFFFALISKDALYLKVDESNRQAFVSRGMEPFRPMRNKPGYEMSYYEVPAEILEDPEELAVWARRSVAIAAATARLARRGTRRRR